MHHYQILCGMELFVEDIFQYDNACKWLGLIKYRHTRDIRDGLKGEFAVVPTDKICGRSLSIIPVDMNSIFMKLSHDFRSHTSEIWIFEVIFVDFKTDEYFFNKTESFV
jgi:hypothetical protein